MEVCPYSPKSNYFMDFTDLPYKLAWKLKEKIQSVLEESTLLLFFLNTRY